MTRSDKGGGEEVDPSHAEEDEENAWQEAIPDSWRDLFFFS